MFRHHDHSSEGPAHEAPSSWIVKEVSSLMTPGTIHPDALIAILKGNVSVKSLLGERDEDGHSLHRPGEHVRLFAPKSTSLVRPVYVDHEI